jgi:hypothetical protein
VKLTRPSTNRGFTTGSTSCTIADLKQDALLWYKIHVLLYDLCHISSNRASEARTLCTTDELYISGPYFTPSEAIRIKATTVEPAEVLSWSADGNEDLPAATDTAIDRTEATLPDSTTRSITTATVEESIQSHLSSFLDKRKASGDSRPCGPHDLGPIYRGVFGISQTELLDEKFLTRLRRSGLGDASANMSTNNNNKERAKKGKKMKRRG